MKLAAAFAALTLAATLAAQVAGPANSGYQTEQQRKAVANGLADPARDEKQKPAVAIRQAGKAPAAKPVRTAEQKLLATRRLPPVPNANLLHRMQ